MANEEVLQRKGRKKNPEAKKMEENKKTDDLNLNPADLMNQGVLPDNPTDGEEIKTPTDNKETENDTENKKEDTLTNNQETEDKKEEEKESNNTDSDGSNNEIPGSDINPEKTLGDGNVIKPLTEEEIAKQIEQQQQNANSENLEQQTDFFNSDSNKSQNGTGGESTPMTDGIKEPDLDKVFKSGKYKGKAWKDFTAEEKEAWRREQREKKDAANLTKNTISEEINSRIQLTKTVNQDHMANLTEFQNIVYPYIDILSLVVNNTPKPTLGVKLNYKKTGNEYVKQAGVSEERYQLYKDNEAIRKSKGKVSKNVKKQEIFEFTADLSVSNPAMGSIMGAVVKMPSALYNYIKLIQQQDFDQLTIPTIEELNSAPITLKLTNDEFNWFVSAICGSKIKENKIMQNIDASLYNGVEGNVYLKIEQHTGEDKKTKEATTTRRLVASNRKGSASVLTKYNMVPITIYKTSPLNSISMTTKARYKAVIETKLKEVISQNKNVASKLNPKLNPLFKITENSVSANFLDQANPGTLLMAYTKDENNKNTIEQKVWGEYIVTSDGIKSKVAPIPVVLEYSSKTKKDNTGVTYTPIYTRLGSKENPNTHTLASIQNRFPAAELLIAEGVKEAELIDIESTYNSQKQVTNMAKKGKKETVLLSKYTQEQVQELENLALFGISEEGTLSEDTLRNNKKFASKLLSGMAQQNAQK